MTKVFQEAFSVDGALSAERLRLLKMIFDELCDEHDLTHDNQDGRDNLALALVESGKVTSDEAELRDAGLRAIVTM